MKKVILATLIFSLMVCSIGCKWQDSNENKTINPVEDASQSDTVQELKSGDDKLMGEKSIVLPIDMDFWKAGPDWLGNPTSNPALKKVSVPSPYSENGDGWRFEVPEAGKGMKWHHGLDDDELIDITNTPYIMVRYRAENITNSSGQAHNDYFVFIGDPEEKEYIPIRLNQIQDDGRWKTAVGYLPSIKIKLIAIQVQAGRPDAFIEVGSIGFYSEDYMVQLGESESPVAISSLIGGVKKLSDDLDYANNWDNVNQEDFESIPLVRTRLDVASAFETYEFDGEWFKVRRVAVKSRDTVVPFTVNVQAPQLAATALDGVETLDIEIGKDAKAIYLLMGARFVGQEDPSLGSGAIKTISQVERFLLEIHYEDGTSEQIFPQLIDNGNYQIKKGFGVYVVTPSQSKVISRLVLRDEMRNGAFYIAGITIGKKRWAFAEDLPKVLAPASIAVNPGKKSGKGKIYEAEGNIVFETNAMKLVMTATNQPQIISLKNLLTDTEMLQAPSPVFEYMGRSGSGDLSVENVKVSNSLAKIALAAKDTKLELTGRFDTNGEVVFGLKVVNQGKDAIAPKIRFPAIRNVAFTNAQQSTPAQLWYVYPRRGAYISDRVFDAGVLYSGYFPMQFLSFFSPDLGGFYIITRDLELTHKIFELKKTNQQTGSISVYYDNTATNTIEANASLVLPDTSLGVYGQSWQESFLAYKDWVSTWYEPTAPRKEWFREVFNFRQQFLHFEQPIKTGMYDPIKKVFNFQPTIDQDIEAFGSVDYLHLFDWAWTPDHGRVGDYEPWNYLGSSEAFKEAIDAVHEQGIPVGLYLEGYLLSPESLMGMKYGSEWQMLDKNQKPYTYWSPNYDLCSHNKPWQDYLTDTLKRIWELTGARGFYIDQLGFAGYEKFCYNKNHDHAPGVPAIRGEAEILKKARSVLPEDVVIYTEEAPVDVITQYQDGAFSYAVGMNEPDWSPHGLNLYRFAFPDFKTFEIINVDKPIGSNYQSLKQVFFNGEGVWLSGTASEWFTPETLAFIRKMNQVLRDHADAFTSSEPYPLYPTLSEGVYANMFPASGKTVWTLYNSNYRSVSTEVIKIEHKPGAEYTDIWNDRPLAVRIDGDDAYITVDIPPKGVVAIMQKTK